MSSAMPKLQARECSRKIAIHKRRAAAVHPIERPNSVRPGRNTRCFVHQRFMAFTAENKPQPIECIADGRLPRFVAVVAGKNSIFHDTGDTSHGTELLGIEHMTATRA